MLLKCVGNICCCQRTSDEKVVDIELKTSDYVGQDLSNFDRLLMLPSFAVFSYYDSVLSTVFVSCIAIVSDHSTISDTDWMHTLHFFKIWQFLCIYTCTVKKSINYQGIFCAEQM